MDYINSILLGFLQGITEFLPISSSGHLVIFQYLLGIESPGIILEVVFHLGTLVSILFYYWDDIRDLFDGLISRKNEQLNYIFMLFVSTLPALIVIIISGSYLEHLFSVKYVPKVAAGAGFNDSNPASTTKGSGMAYGFSGSFGVEGLNVLASFSKPIL